MALEEVVLVEPTEIPVANPPAKVDTPTAPVATDKSETAPESNPNFQFIEKFTQGVSLMSMAVGMVGIVATVVIPKMVKWVTGWKDLAATLLTTAIGGFVIGKISKPAAVAFIIGAGGVFLVKALRFAISGFKTTSFLGDWSGKLLDDEEEVLGDEEEVLGEDEDVLGADYYDAGLFAQADTSADKIIPTSGIDDF